MPHSTQKVERKLSAWGYRGYEKHAWITLSQNWITAFPSVFPQVRNHPFYLHARSQRLTSMHRSEPAPRLAPVSKPLKNPICLLICFLIEFLLPFFRLVNPCTGLWADDWRVITGCWHTCFLCASALARLAAKAAKSFAWSISAPHSAPPSLIQVCFTLLSSPSCPHAPTLLCSSSSLSACIRGKITPQREL